MSKLNKSLNIKIANDKTKVEEEEDAALESKVAVTKQFISALPVEKNSDEASLLRSMLGILSRGSRVPQLRQHLMTKEFVEDMLSLMDHTDVRISYKAARVLGKGSNKKRKKSVEFSTPWSDPPTHPLGVEKKNKNFTL